MIRQMILNRIVIWLFAAYIGLSVAGCEMPTQVTAGNTDITVEDTSDIPDEDDGNQVCDPFGNSGHASRTNGLKGELFYLSDDLPHYQNVADYQEHGLKLDADLFFSQLNVPTRPFDQGFMTQNGTILKTPDGDTLYEWFSVHFETEIGLADRDQEGYYQFALLSDDGSTFHTDDGRGFSRLVNNDGEHPTKLACATNTVYLQRGQRLPSRIDYYQGPRFHIALMLLWRKVDPNHIPNEPLCNQSGNDLFFDSQAVPPAAQSAWMQLLSRGWKVVTPENYFLPQAVGPNPCPTASPTPVPTASPTPTPTPAPSATPAPTATPSPTPTPNPGGTFGIFGFDAASSTDSMFVIWQTPGVPSTSQVFYGLTPYSLDMESSYDATLVESHGVTITGLPSQTRFYLQAVSISQDGRVSFSDVISKTTK